MRSVRQSYRGGTKLPYGMSYILVWYLGSPYLSPHEAPYWPHIVGTQKGIGFTGARLACRNEVVMNVIQLASKCRVLRFFVS